NTWRYSGATREATTTQPSGAFSALDTTGSPDQRAPPTASDRRRAFTRTHRRRSYAAPGRTWRPATDVSRSIVLGPGIEALGPGTSCRRSTGTNLGPMRCFPLWLGATGRGERP